MLSVPVMKTNHLGSYTEIIAVRLEIHAKHVSMTCGQKIVILGAFANLRKVGTGVVRSVCPSASKNWDPAEIIFIKFDISLFLENLSRKFF